MPVARGDAVALARELIKVDSRNPSLVPGGPGERAVARALGDILLDWGFRVELIDASAGRPNVVARIGRDAGRRLMFNGHLDVVGTDGMIHDPWAAPPERDRIYGRGASDMKAGVAAMCAAAVRASEGDGIDGEVIVAAVVDEEFESIGTRALLERGVRADAAIVTEPTQLAVMPAHLGFVWVQITIRGRAAHGSRWDLGIDAIRHAGLLLGELDAMDEVELPTRSHPLLGRPSIHASTIEGGTGMSTYPDRCVITVERRTIPGEAPEAVRAEIEAACARVRTWRPVFESEVSVTFSQAPSDVHVAAPIVLALANSLRAEGESVRVAGMSAWTDAALLNAAGVPAICFGPGDMSLAHSAEEWVEVEEIERATRVLSSLAGSWCGQRGGTWVS